MLKGVVKKCYSTLGDNKIKKKSVLEGDYGFHEAFNIFEESDINCNNLYEYQYW